METSLAAQKIWVAQTLGEGGGELQPPSPSPARTPMLIRQQVNHENQVSQENQVNNEKQFNHLSEPNLTTKIIILSQSQRGSKTFTDDVICGY